MKKYGIKGILGITFALVGLVFLIICTATDINDDLFLPLALGCEVVGEALNLWFQLEMRKKSKSEHENTNKNGENK